MSARPHRPTAPSPSDRRRSPEGVRARLILTAALVLGGGVAGCGDGADAPMEDATPAADQGAPGSVEGAGMPLGDPVDDGFAPVVDTEVDPADDPVTADVDLGVDGPDAVMADLGDRIDAAAPSGELLDAVGPIDDAADVPTDPDGRARNEVGELVRLDGAASLACGRVEIAIGLIDDGQTADAAELVRSGAGQADASAISDVRSWADPLRSAADRSLEDPTALVGFLTVCIEGGYEL